jgi:hypothetical protein
VCLGEGEHLLHKVPRFYRANRKACHGWRGATAGGSTGGDGTARMAGCPLTATLPGRWRGGRRRGPQSRASTVQSLHARQWPAEGGWAGQGTRLGPVPCMPLTCSNAGKQHSTSPTRLDERRTTRATERLAAQRHPTHLHTFALQRQHSVTPPPLPTLTHTHTQTHTHKHPPHLHALALPRQVGLVVLSEPQRLAAAAQHSARVAAVRCIQLVACGAGEGRRLGVGVVAVVGWVVGAAQWGGGGRVGVG